MNTVITVYAYDAFKRYLLPAINDADYSLHLPKNLYSLEESIVLRMEIIKGQWFFAPSDAYDIVDLSGRSVLLRRRSLDQLISSNNSVLQVTVDRKTVLTLTIQKTSRYFAAFSRYQLSAGVSEITIGRDASNVLSYAPPGQGLISGRHASLVHQQDGWYICDLNSVNGTFVNNKRVLGSRPLAFGDCIDIFGLRIVYLGREIAVNVIEQNVRVQSNRLIVSSHTVVRLMHPNTAELQTVFHRSPRHLASLETEDIVIDEAPPPRDAGHNTTILGAIGSSIAMALPMLLGCAFMIYASSMSGAAQSVFMFVGVITSVASAAIGVVRSLTSIRKARLEREEFENMRNRKYGEYLHERELLISQQYQKNTTILCERYQPAEVICTYSANESSLWSKNVSQPDFLTHRIGVGTMPFQVQIKTPTRKFTLTDNALAELPDQIKAKYSTLNAVPLCVDLANEHLVGIVEKRDALDGPSVVRALVAQIVANNSYTDVKLAFVYNRAETDQDGEWSYCHWLPHVWNETHTFRYVATNEEEAREVFFELNRVLRERIEGQSASREQRSNPIPHYILVLASPELMEGEIIAQYALNSKPEYGLTTIYLAERYEELPNECTFIVQNDQTFRGMYHSTDNLDERVPIAIDMVSAMQVRQLAESIANVRVREIQSGGEVPQSLTFFEMLGIHKPEELDSANLWRKNRTYESMRALIGQRAGGTPCYLDIHEKYHGPHGLVAGTTGSGKSETLQTFILSLSINFSPDDVGFFIIDYKGGGMANLFEGLPHLVGRISNLSGSQVNRALAAMQSEKNRRESIFAEYGVKDIRDYTKLVKSGEATVPIPHLIIVIDEFAEMKNDEPEFIQEVVSISRVGRSLGIHLIMATQRPAGAVSEDIWSNSRFKLCLRVQSKQDSVDMLKKPDAAYLTQSGRCYLQVGNDELFELFQSGYSGATYSPDASANQSAIATMLTANGTPSLVGNHTLIKQQRKSKRAWIKTLLSCVRNCGYTNARELARLSYADLESLTPYMYDQLEQQGIDYPKNDYNTEALTNFLMQVSKLGFSADALMMADDVPGNKNRLPQKPQRTQLEAVVGYLKKTAQDNGYTRDYSLFLPLLPHYISLSELPQSNVPWGPTTVFDGTHWPTPTGQPSLAVALGIYDDPFNQRQDAFVYDPLQEGSMAIYGAPQTGKSTFLQTLVFGTIMRYSPQQVNVYAIEYSAQRLSPLANAPHVGGIVRDSDDLDRVDKLITLLHRMTHERKGVLRESSYLEHLRARGLDAMPAVFVLIDNYAAFAQRTNDAYGPFLRKLIREGAAYGMYVVATAAGVGSGEIPSAMSQEFRTTVCLELPNVYDYASYLRRNRLRIQPEAGVPGRGICVVGDRPLEFQMALPYHIKREAGTADALRSTAKLMRARWQRQTAMPIPSIPQDPTWDDLISLVTTQNMIAGQRMLPFGWDARLAEPCGVDLSNTYAYLISGARRKGKTNALRVLMLSAVQQGARVIAVDFSGNSNAFCKREGIECVDSEDEFSHVLADLMPTIVERNQKKAALQAGGSDEYEVFEEMNSFERICFFVENLPEFVDRSHNPKEPLQTTYDDFLSTVADKCSLHNIFWFFTVDKADLGSASGYAMFKDFVRDHKGMHLGGQVYSTAIGELRFDNHDRRALDNARPLGRAMLAADNETSTLEAVIPQIRRAKTQ